MSDSNIPPLPELPPMPSPYTAARLAGDDWDLFTDVQMRAYAQSYGLLCLRQGWKMGAEKCAEACRENVLYDSSQARVCAGACDRIASDSPK